MLNLVGDVLDLWGLKGKTLNCTTDSAFNMQRASRLLAEEDEFMTGWIPCASHKMQNIMKRCVEKGPQGVQLLFRKVEVLASALRTPTGGKLLANAQRIMEVPQRKSLSYTDVRWNSKFMLAERLLEHNMVMGEIERLATDPRASTADKKYWADNKNLLLTEASTNATWVVCGLHAIDEELLTSYHFA